MREVAKTRSPYQIDHLSTLEQLDALETEWSELLDENPDAPIFLTWEWIRTWWLHFGQGRQLWLLTARDKQGRLVGIAPLMREGYRKGLMRLDTLAFIGTGPACPTHLKVLACAPDKEGVYRAFLGFLQAQRGQWDVLRIASVAMDSAEYPWLTAAGGRVRTGGQTICSYMPLPADWGTFLNTADPHARSRLRSIRARLERNHPGMVQFSCITDPRDLDSAMAKLEELIRNRCHAKALATDWDDPTFATFHRAIASLALSRGWLRLYTLAVGDHVIAVVYNFRFKDWIYGYNAGFDPNWKQYSPSRLLLEHLIKSSIEEAVSVLDMGPGRSEYKSALTDRERVENEILFGHNWKGNLWITFGNLERAIRTKVKRLLVRPDKKQMNQPRSMPPAKTEEGSPARCAVAAKE